MSSIVLLIGMVIVAAGALYVIGMRTQRKELPESLGLKQLTPTGVAWGFSLVAGFLGGKTAQELAPESGLGTFLNHWHGMPVALIVWIIIFSVAAGILHRLGHPVFKRKGQEG
jgi:hypothetical protein